MQYNLEDANNLEEHKIPGSRGEEERKSDEHS